MTRKITCSFTLTEEIIDYIDDHAGVEGRSALVRQMMVDYIHSTEIREYKHRESGLRVSAFRCYSHDLIGIRPGEWVFYDGQETGTMSDGEFRITFAEVDEE